MQQYKILGKLKEGKKQQRKIHLYILLQVKNNDLSLPKVKDFSLNLYNLYQDKVLETEKMELA